MIKNAAISFIFIWFYEINTFVKIDEVHFSTVIKFFSFLIIENSWTNRSAELSRFKISTYENLDFIPLIKVKLLNLILKTFYPNTFSIRTKFIFNFFTLTTWIRLSPNI